MEGRCALGILSAENGRQITSVPTLPQSEGDGGGVKPVGGPRWWIGKSLAGLNNAIISLNGLQEQELIFGGYL